MLATRIRQKDAEFYFVNYPAREILKRVRFVTRFYFEGEQIEAAPLTGDEIGDFIAKVERSDKAFQRPLKQRKVRDLVHFYESVSSQPAIPGIILLVTPERLNFRAMPGQESIGTLNEPANHKFDIIDGQHRLAGLYFFSKRLEGQGKGGVLDSIEVPTLVFDGKTIDFAAEMFVTINATQTKINRSHLVDLLEKVTLASPEEKFAARLVRLLYEEDRSPLQYKINLLGGRSKAEKWILQSELYNEILRLVGTPQMKRGPIRGIAMRRWEWKAERALPVLTDYLKAVRDIMGDAWGDREYQVTSAVALKAYFRAFGDLLEDSQMLDAYERVRAPSVFVDKLRDWAQMKEDLRTEGFFNRFPAKGQLERVRMIQKELGKRVR